MKLARLLLGIFRRHRLKEYRVNCALQAAQSSYSHAQMGHNNAVSDYFSIYSAEAQGLQRDVSNAVPEAVGNRAVHEYEGSVSACNSGGFALDGGNNFGHGFLAHDNSYRLFKWDARKDCMIPFEKSNPISFRLRRACQAFVNAWRMP